MEAVAQPVVIDLAGLDALLRGLVAAGVRVLGPVARDGAIVTDEIAGLEDLPAGWVDAQEPGRYELRREGRALFGHVVGPDSPRRSLLPPTETVLSIRRDGGRVVLDAEPPAEAPLALVGVRACDLAAVAIQDRVWRDGDHPDPAYVARRDRALLIAVNCATPASTCFCTSMGTGPAVTAGHDLALTELVDDGPHRFVVDVGTDRGAALLEQVTTAPATDQDLAAARAVPVTAASLIERRLDPEAARDTLAASLEHERWDDVAERCLSCSSCTLVCPTCFCTTIEQHTSLDGESSERVRSWDSCFSLDHSYVHGAGAVRSDTRSRYRQWLTHKLSTWWDQYGVSGCVGCGRCVTWCPVGIDLVEEVRAMAAAAPIESPVVEAAP